MYYLLLCYFLVYLLGAASDLLAGTLKLMYCGIPLAKKSPTWSLPREGNAARLLTPGNMETCVDLHIAEGCVFG